jgi:aminoglycoside phosphotransferase (APT) family kinase protein
LPIFDAFDSEGVRRRLVAYLNRELGEDVEIGPLKRFTVGFSWVTYGFSAQWRARAERIGRELILRVGPPNGIFAPYRATPEFLALQTLADSSVPAPRVYWRCEDEEVLGAPFFISEFVEGEAPIPWTAKSGAGFDETVRLNLGDQFVAALAALHKIDWRETPAAGIDGASLVDETAAAQIDYWAARMRSWSERRYPILEWALLWFRARAPKARQISLVHGDYRIGNFLEHQGRIVAILDWELVHLGDPMEDLGWVCLQAWRGRAPYMCRLLTREELQAKYEALTGAAIDVAAWRYWEAFGTFKLAVMHLGASHCFEARGFNDLRMAGMGAQLPRVLLQLETALGQAA